MEIMEVLSEKVEQSVVEQRFDLQVDGGSVPGIRWSPEGAKVTRPTILIGHGETQHKRDPNVLGLAMTSGSTALHGEPPARWAPPVRAR